MSEAAWDQYWLAQAYQDYSDAENKQINLQNSYQLAEQRAAQQQNVPRPMSDAEDLQRHIWHTAVEVQPGQVSNSERGIGI